MGENRADHELLPDPERARVRARDRKAGRPRMVVDNVSVKKAAVERARKAAEARRRPGSDEPPG